MITVLWDYKQASKGLGAGDLRNCQNFHWEIQWKKAILSWNRGKFQTFVPSSPTTLIGCRPIGLGTHNFRVNQSDGIAATISLFSLEIWEKKFLKKKFQKISLFFGDFFLGIVYAGKFFLVRILMGKKIFFFGVFRKVANVECFAFRLGLSKKRY